MRYRRKIIVYLLRSLVLSGGNAKEFPDHADDWLQEVFTKLIHHNGRVIRSFRGSNDPSAHAFLASIAASVVADHLRSQRAIRRRASVFSIDDNEGELPEPGVGPQVDTLLELIDIEKMLKTEGYSANPQRDLLIFKLHFVEGLTASEIASIPTFNLTKSGLEKVFARIRQRISRGNTDL